MYGRIQQNEKGFTLIELLVVILIIGILFAIALPAFINQREKSQDADAMQEARLSQTVIETFYVDNQTYDGGDKAALEGIEPAIKQFSTRLTVTPNDRTYTVAVESKGANKIVYAISRTAEGGVERSCAPVGKGACPDNGTW